MCNRRLQRWLVSIIIKNSNQKNIHTDLPLCGLNAVSSRVPVRRVSAPTLRHGAAQIALAELY